MSQNVEEEEDDNLDSLHEPTFMRVDGILTHVRISPDRVTTAVAFSVDLTWLDVAVLCYSPAFGHVEGFGLTLHYV